MPEAFAHIRTRKIPATDFKGAQIVAYTTDRAKQITLGYPYEANDPHAYVAMHLARLITGNQWASVQEISCYSSGYKFRVINGE